MGTWDQCVQIVHVFKRIWTFVNGLSQRCRITTNEFFRKSGPNKTGLPVGCAAATSSKLEYRKLTLPLFLARPAQGAPSDNGASLPLSFLFPTGVSTPGKLSHLEPIRPEQRTEPSLWEVQVFYALTAFAFGKTFLNFLKHRYEWKMRQVSGKWGTWGSRV